MPRSGREFESPDRVEDFSVEFEVFEASGGLFLGFQTSCMPSGCLAAIVEMWLSGLVKSVVMVVAMHFLCPSWEQGNPSSFI